MELPQQLDDFMKNSIDHTMGLEVPDQTLQSKLQSLETANYRLRSQYHTLQSRLMEKEDALERARAESSLNAQAIKRFVEENQKLAEECVSLVNQCSKLERECSLYDQDREALMEFGNEADERAQEAEIRAGELEEELKRVTQEVQLYKSRAEMIPVDSSAEGVMMEQNLLNRLVASLVNQNEVAKTASDFLEATSEVEACRELLKLWNSLRPETLNVLSIAAYVRTLQTDKEHLRINLNTAEEEVRVLFEDNNMLLEEKKRLLKICASDRKHTCSGGKHCSSATPKSNKRKTSPGFRSPLELKFEICDAGSPRRPLSPLKENSPTSKSFKK